MEFDGKDPWWLAWIVPVATLLGLFGAGLMWLARKVLLPGVKAELDVLLKEKFEDLNNQVNVRHQQNRDDLDRLELRLNGWAIERAEMRQDLNSVKTDVAFLRGRMSGSNHRK